MASRPEICVALDAMGGDHAPSSPVEGALRAVRAGLPARVVLVGDAGRVEAELKRAGAKDGEVELVPAAEAVGMQEKTRFSWRRRRDNSLSVAAGLIHEGTAQALVSAGNTGAVVSTSLLIIGRIRGVSRPAIGTIFPSLTGHVVILDVGANVDPKPKWFAEFAVMGSVYARHLFGVEEPRVGLLNIGEEESKGNSLTQSAYSKIEKSGVNFIGNVQGHEIMSGDVDVVVTDGFVGNVILKFAEGTERVIKKMLRREVIYLTEKAGALLIGSAMRRFFGRFDYAEYGGAPLLGLKGTIIICHGSSSPRAIARALEVAANAVKDGVNQKIKAALGHRSLWRKES